MGMRSPLRAISRPIFRRSSILKPTLITPYLRQRPSTSVSIQLQRRSLHFSPPFTQQSTLQSESHQKRQSWYASEELLDRYCEGGYHPVKIGDTFHDGRYEVVRKLGWGRYSTIWLARDKQKDRYVSLKILTSEWTPRESLLSEAAFLRRASSASPTHPGFPHVLTLLDELRFSGPNGEHIVLVTDVLGEDLVRVRRRYDGGRLPAGVVKQVAKQVLLGLQYLHVECGMTHTDIKPDNILIALPSPHLSSPAQLPSAVSNKFIDQCLSVLKPQTETVTTPSGEPVPITVSQALPIFAMRQATSLPSSSSPSSSSPTTTSATFSKKEDKPLEINVKIVDLGVANWNDDHWADTIQSPAMRAPEVLLGAGWGTKADIWSMGCLVYELLTGEWLFTPLPHPPSLSAEQDHLHQMAALLGPLPPSLIARSKRASELLDGWGQLPPLPGELERQSSPHGEEEEKEPLIRPPPISLEQRLERLQILKPDEFVGTVSFLRAMLQLEPDNRAGARELLEHAWVREGGEVHWWSGV